MSSNYLRIEIYKDAVTRAFLMNNNTLLSILATLFLLVGCVKSRSTRCILAEYEMVLHYADCKTTIKTKSCVAKGCMGLHFSNNYLDNSVCNPTKWMLKPYLTKFQCNGKEKQLRVNIPEPIKCG